MHCEGYGFKVLNCIPFKLSPNATKRIEIVFTPDFTLSRIERKLLVLTSMGPDGGNVENGVVILNLLATLPAHSLDSCALALARPLWEHSLQWAAFSISCILLVFVFATSFIEADRILRGALTGYLKKSPLQPPLDLRILSNISTHTAPVLGDGSAVAVKNEKIINDEKIKAKVKDDTFPDWSLMNVKKCKDKDIVQKGLKIPDWSADEERRFKLDTESKDPLSFKRCEELPITDNISVSTTTCGAKKRNHKKQNTQEAQSDNCMANDSFTDVQLLQEKKYIVNTVTKSSPTSNRKGKTTIQSSVKEEPKLIDHEIQVDAGMINNNRINKPENKRKQTNIAGNNSNHNNHVSLKKFESTNIQKVVHLSEEETSSTTTESSTHDETTLCKVSTGLLYYLY